MHMHTNGSDSTMLESASEYSLLAPVEPAGDPAVAELQEHRDGHKSTMGTGVPDTRETETGDRNRKRALLVCVQTEDADEERIPPERQRSLNMCVHQGGEGGGGPLNHQRAPTTCSQGLEGEPLTRQRTPPVSIQVMEEDGYLPPSSVHNLSAGRGERGTP